MKTFFIVLLLSCASFAQISQPGTGSGSAFAGGSGSSYQDVVESAAPSNPSAGTCRFYADSTSHKLAGLNSAGASCMPSASVTGTDTYVTFFDGANNPAGDAGMTYNKTTDALTVAGVISASSITTTGTAGALVPTAIADVTTANGFWLSSTTANRWKTYVNSVTQTFAYQSDSVSTMAAPSTTVTTSTPVSVSSTDTAGFYYNEHATAATAIVYNLPTAAAGKQFCFANAYNGSAANTGTVKLVPSATGQFIIFTDGTLTTNTTGYVISGGAAGDAGCVVGVDSTHWILYVQRGTWTKA